MMSACVYININNDITLLYRSLFSRVKLISTNYARNLYDKNKFFFHAHEKFAPEILEYK